MKIFKEPRQIGSHRPSEKVPPTLDSLLSAFTALSLFYSTRVKFDFVSNLATFREERVVCISAILKGEKPC